MRLLLLLSACIATVHAQQPDIVAQRAAMKKLEFLVGKWSGGASVARGPGEPMRIIQSEDVQFRLDGLVVLLEGTGRNAEGQRVFGALAVIAYDEATSTYRFRAFNDGRFLDTELKDSEQWLFLGIHRWTSKGFEHHARK